MFLCFYTDGLFPRVYYTEKRKTKRKKNSNVQNQNLLESAQGELPQREERIRKTFFLCFYTD